MGAYWTGNQWLLPNNENKDKISNYNLSLEEAEYGDMGYASNFLGTTEFSFNVWFKKLSDNPEPGPNYMASVSYQDRFAIDQDLSEIKISINSYINTGSFDFSVANGDPNDTWYNLQVFYSGSGATNGDKLRAFLNGEEKTLNYGVGTIPSSIDAFSTNNHINIGAWRTSPTYYGFQGNISNVAAWTSSIVDSVSSIYNDGTPPDLTSLNPQGWWRMGRSEFLVNAYHTPNFNNWGKVGNYSFHNNTNTGKHFDILGNPTSLQISGGELSISYWFQNDFQSGGEAPLFKKGTTGNEDYGLFVGDLWSGEPIFKLRASGSGEGTLHTLAGTTNTRSKTIFHHVLATYGSGSGLMKIYVDGALEVSSSIGDVKIRNMMSGSSILGNPGNNYNISWFAMTQIAMYDTDQSSNATALYNGGEPINEASKYAIAAPVSYWRADKAWYSGSSYWHLPDQTGNAIATGSYNTYGWLVPQSPNGDNGYFWSMEIGDREGNAPSSSMNSYTVNMDEIDRVTNVPS